MFKFTTIPNSDLDKIRAMKEGNLIYKRFDMMGGQPPVTFTFPHECYTLHWPKQLDTDNEQDFKPIKSGVRVIEATKDHFRQIFDLNKTNEGSEPQMFQDEKLLKTYEQAFNSILGTSMEDENYEVRILKIPALHQEALWLHNSENEIKDKFLPVKILHWETELKVFSLVEFINLLNQHLPIPGQQQDTDNDSMKGG